MPAIMWFRRDLRLRDNPALAAAASGQNVIGLFVLTQCCGIAAAQFAESGFGSLCML